MTLSAYNLGRVRARRSRRARASARASRSTTSTSTWRRCRGTTTATPRWTAMRAGSGGRRAAELREYRALRGTPRSPQQLLEHAYLEHLDEFLPTGRTPMPCHALRASCFIDPWGVVYPCITYSRPIGRLRDTGMRLEPIWNARRDRRRCRARSGRATARSAGPPARRIRAFSATRWPVAPAAARRSAPIAVRNDRARRGASDERRPASPTR